jgi:hypothetical protein
MARPGTENGIRPGVVPGHVGAAPPPDSGGRTLRDSPLIRHGAKVILGLILAGLVTGATFIHGLRDTARDNAKAVEAIEPIEVRVRAVEDAVLESRRDMRWIRESLRDVKAAVGADR